MTRSEMFASFRPIEIKLDFRLILYYLNGVINLVLDERECVFIFLEESLENKRSERTSPSPLYGNFDDSRLASRVDGK